MTKTPEIQIPALIRKNPRSFIQIPQLNALIAVEQTHNGKNTYQQLESLAGEQMEMPSPFTFMTHRQYTFKASQGKSQLLYADNTEVPRNISKDLWKRLSSGHNGGCWTRLNALFIQEETHSSPWHSDISWYIETDLKVVNNKQGKSLKGIRQPLDTTVLHENCYTTLAFNPQGLSIEKSSIQSYNAKKNIYFGYPQNGAVARFNADSDGASLSCIMYPTSRDASLGVFASARGAQAIAKILEGKN